MSSYQPGPGQTDPRQRGRDAPARLGRYELLGQLATGGMAEIHLARLAGEAGFEKIVVIKRLLPELVASPAYVAMFLDEGRLVARLAHPNICEVFDLGRDGAEYFLAMPYLEGVSVHDLIARPRDPDRIGQLRTCAGVIVQACEGLHHAHELRDADGGPAGLVHRDVSPSNLFVTTAGVVKVLDFGIAKVRGAAETEVGTVKGKSQYMAPEQLLGEAVDRRCDVFALGIVLFELATHQRLFKRASEYLTAKAVLEEPIPRADAVDPAIPAAFADVIAKALARDPAQRYADARALAAAVTEAIAPHGGVAGPAEIAGAIVASAELTQQKTRQARVLEDARSRLTDVATSPHASARTRPLRKTPPFGIVDPAEPDPAVRRRRAAIRLAIVLAVVAIVVVFALLPVLGGGGDQPAASLPPGGAIDAGPGSATVTVTEPPRDAISEALPLLDAGLGSAEPPPVRVDPTPPKPGLLSIESTPWATIYLDGQKLGITPLVKRSVPAGRHKLRAVLADGRSREQTVDIPAGRLAAPIQLTW